MKSQDKDPGQRMWSNPAGTYLSEPVCKILGLVFPHIHHLLYPSPAREHECRNIYLPGFCRVFQASRNRIDRWPCGGFLFPTSLQTFPNPVGKPQLLRIPWPGWPLPLEDDLTSQLRLSSSCERRSSGEHLVLVRNRCHGRRVNTNFVDDHGKCIDVACDGGLVERIIRGQKFWRGPIDGCPGQRERIEYDRVQAKVPEKSSWRLAFIY